MALHLDRMNHLGDAKDSESECFLSDDEAAKTTKFRHASGPTVSERLALLFFFLGCTLFGASLWLHLHPKISTDQECARKLSFPSPVHEVLEYEDVQFDNAFWKPSPYKGKPTPDLEAKWKDLWYYGSFDLPDMYLPALNKSADGIGGNGWARTKSGNLLAGLEVFHNLHCLNLMRQYAHRDEYDYSDDPAFHGSDELVRAHVDHCIEALRIRLMCSAGKPNVQICYSFQGIDSTIDVTPFLHTTGSKGIQPDFDSQHRCPKFDRIIEWAKEKQIMVEKQDPHQAHGHHAKASRA
ncbi:hypothetical protein CCHL11_10099 [Colletotrichum chlorophyti]|uniref:Cyclochlorotine biosynthesis protein O n=1 Tax=Colletotrichum chlorophyti TaxID=708187 RepID=A0A1Q8RTD4_9PEZI|nr:hypothetical protein CCHL11_10099 [Colletotrichum chlorophyti]